jgi:hypothetical protein
MTKKPSSLAAFLKKLYRAAEALTDGDISVVVSGRKRLVVRTEEEAKAVEGNLNFEPHDCTQLVGMLKSAETREQAQQIIEEAKLTREDLARLAKALDLPIRRTEDSDRVIEKVIERTVGFRLRSQAIHGKPL